MRRPVKAALIGLLVGATAALAAQAKPETAQPITGQCRCGHVKFTAQHPIVKCSACDCRGCQRATGTLKAPFVTVRPDAFAITAGTPATFRAKSKAPCDCNGVWHFCPKCGSPLFWKPHNGKQVDLFAGTLDDTSIYKPKK